MRFIKRLILLLKMPLYLIRGNRVHWSATVDTGAFMRKCTVGKYCYIGRNSVLNSVEVGNYSCIAAGVQIGGMEHSIDEYSISPALTGNKCLLGRKTVIGHDVWVAANCIIKQGVKIGDGAVIGANSFVNKDVEPYSICFGSPAKFYRYRKCKEKETDLNRSKYWELSPDKAKKKLAEIKSTV